MYKLKVIQSKITSRNYFLSNVVPVSEPVAVRGECDCGHGEDEDDHAEGGVVDAHSRRLDQLLEVLLGIGVVGFQDSVPIYYVK